MSLASREIRVDEYKNPVGKDNDVESATVEQYDHIGFDNKGRSYTQLHIRKQVIAH